MNMKNFFLLHFFLLNLSEGINFLEESVSVLSKRDEENRELSSCVNIAVEKLFKPNQIIEVLISDDSSGISYDESQILQNLMKFRVLKILKTTRVIESDYDLLQPIPAILIFYTGENQLENSSVINRLKGKSRFIVIINETMNSVERLSSKLRISGFRKIAFIRNSPHSRLDNDTSIARNIVDCRELIANSKSIHLEPNIRRKFQVLYVFNEIDKTSNSTSLIHWIMRRIKNSMKMKMANYTGFHYKYVDPNSAVLEGETADFIYIQDADTAEDFSRRMRIVADFSLVSTHVVDRIRERSLRGFKLQELFPTHVWYVAIASSIAISISISIMNLVQRSAPNHKIIAIGFIFKILMGQPLTRMSKNLYYRFCVGLWLYLVLIITIVFNVNYSSTVTSISPAKPLRSFEDVLKSRQTIWSRESYRNQILKSPNPMMANIKYRLNVTQSSEIIGNILRFDSLGILQSNEVLRHNKRNHGMKSRQLYVISNTEILRTQSWIFGRIDSDLNHKCYQICKAIESSGFIIGRAKMSRKGFIKDRTEEENTDDPVFIQFRHLFRIVKFIYGGYILATIVFIAEIFFDRVQTSLFSSIARSK